MTRPLPSVTVRTRYSVHDTGQAWCLLPSTIHNAILNSIHTKLYQLRFCTSSKVTQRTRMMFSAYRFPRTAGRRTMSPQLTLFGLRRHGGVIVRLVATAAGAPVTPQIGDVHAFVSALTSRFQFQERGAGSTGLVSSRPAARRRHGFFAAAARAKKQPRWSLLLPSAESGLNRRHGTARAQTEEKLQYNRAQRLPAPNLTSYLDTVFTRSSCNITRERNIFFVKISRNSTGLTTILHR